MTVPFTPQILPDRALVRLAGDTVLAFLHNLLTCDVAALPARTWAYGALLSPQGKIQHDVFVIHDGDLVFLDCARDQREGLIKKLTLYRLRAKIDIAAADGFSVSVGSETALSALDPRLADMGLRGIVATAATAIAADYEVHRLRNGLADSQADIGVNELFPHEANFDLLSGVSFSKGCYIGQEVVSRMQHRGTARSRILCVTGEADLPPRGTDIRSGETMIGSMLSSAGTVGLALIRLDRLAETTAPLLAGTARLHVHKPKWMTLALDIPDAAA